MSRRRWRMPKPCVDCPFNKTGPGAHLRRSLRPGRMREIKSGLLDGSTFPCHKTTEETGNGTNLLCAGALAFQNGRGVFSDYQQVCERLDEMRRWRLARAPVSGAGPGDRGGAERKG